MSTLKKLFILIVLLVLLDNLKCQDQIYKCSSDMVEQTCPVIQDNQVCALNQQSIYQTYQSACQVCKLGYVQQFTNGECQCPKVKCSQEQQCFQGVCIKKEHIRLKDTQKTVINLYNAGEYKKGVKILNQEIQENPGNHYLFYLKANCNMQLQKYKQALKNIKSAIQRNNQNPNYYVLRGRIMSQLKMYTQSLKQYEKAKQLGYKDLGQLYYYQAQTLLSDKKNQEAIKKFEDAIKLHPTKVQWYLRKAMAHMINEQNAMGIITVKQAKKLNPTERQLYQINGLLKSFNQINEGEHQKLQRQQEVNQRLSTGQKRMQPRIQQDSQGNIKVLNQHGQPVPMKQKDTQKIPTKSDKQQINLDQPVKQSEIQQNASQNSDVKEL